MFDQLYCNLLLSQIASAVQSLRAVAQDNRIGAYDRANISTHLEKINDESIYLQDALCQMIAHQKQKEK